MTTVYNDLKEKVVLITGATRGIGKHIALGFAKNNAHVVFNYRRNEKQALALKEELEQAGASQVTALKFDITDTDTMKAELDKFVKEVAPISGLVNNAGISKDQLAMKVKPEDIDEVFNVNLRSLMILTNHLSRNFLRAKDVSIVNMSSVVGLMGNASQSVYAASKAGVIGYTKSLAKEFATRKIRSNAVCPGFIETDMTKELSDKAKETYIELIPTKEFGHCDDVANLCLFLISTASRYITGEIIKVDGGLNI